MVALETSVNSSGGIYFRRAQEISRYPCWNITEEPAFVDEFFRLVSDNFNFVNNWSQPLINPLECRLY